MDTVRWGIIGVGDVTERKSGPGFRQAPGSDLVAVMRRDGAKAADYARRHRVPRWYDDAAALIADPEVDAVYIATPPDSHAHYTRAVAAAGKPVYVEKPIARTASEAAAMIAACEAAGVPLHVAYYRRALPRFQLAQRLIAGGALGEVGTVLVRQQRLPEGFPAAYADAVEHPTEDDVPWRLRPEISGGGIFVDTASHTLDWLDLALGPITDVAGDATGPGHPRAENRVVASFTFSCGAIGAGVWDFAASQPIDLVEITGDRATLRMSCFGLEPLQVITPEGTSSHDAPTPDTVQLPLITNVVQSLRGEVEPLSTGVTALRTAAVVDSILAGHRARHGIELP